jgi:hypothetical protein
LINLVLLSIIFSLLFLLMQVILIFVYKSIFKNYKDDYIINLSVLERIIDDYVNTILIKEIRQIKRKYNLDPESKINSVLAFEKKCNEIISEASLEILKMITSKMSKSLYRQFSKESLALLIINRVKHTLALD